MKLYHIQTGLLHVNTYFLVNESRGTAIVIDSGEDYKRIKKVESELGICIKAILLTHGHFDHAGNVKLFQDDGVNIYISFLDAKKLLNEDNLAGNFGRKFNYCVADFTFKDGDVLDIEDIKVEIISTPGHTDGSVTFKVDDKLFTGDTLFLESVGRTDFITGSRKDLVKSVKKLFDIKGNYSVYPGHDDFTDLEHERKYNILAEYD